MQKMEDVAEALAGRIKQAWSEFCAPDAHARYMVEWLALPLWRVAALNGTGAGFAAAYAIAAYTTMDASCPKQRLIADALHNAAKFGKDFGRAGMVAIAPAVLLGFIVSVVQGMRVRRRLPAEPAGNALPNIWGGILAIIVSLQLGALLWSTTVFFASFWNVFEIAHEQTPQQLHIWWDKFELGCEQSAWPLAR